MKSASVYRTALDSRFALGPDEAINRWSAEHTLRVLQALRGNSELNGLVNRIEVSLDERPIELLDLRGIDLRDSDLAQADLSYCALDFSNLTNTNLSRCRLQYSRLREANLTGAILDGTQASPVDAQGAVFVGASISRCFFMHSNMEKSDFHNATLNGSHFTEANLEGVNLKGAIGTDVLQIAPRVAIRRWHQFDNIARVELEQRKSARRTARPTVLETLRRAVAELAQAPSVTLYKNDVVVGKVVPSNDKWLWVSVDTEKYKLGSGKVYFKHRIYKTKSSAQWFSVGDVVEIVAYKAHQAPMNSNQRSPSGMGSDEHAFGTRKSKAKEWLVTRLVDTST